MLKYIARPDGRRIGRHTATEPDRNRLETAPGSLPVFLQFLSRHPAVPMPRVFRMRRAVSSLSMLIPKRCIEDGRKYDQSKEDEIQLPESGKIRRDPF